MAYRQRSRREVPLWHGHPFGEGIVRHDAVLVEVHVQDVRAVAGLTIQQDRPIRLLPVEVREDLSIAFRLDAVWGAKQAQDFCPCRLAGNDLGDALFLDGRSDEVARRTTGHDPPGEEQRCCRTEGLLRDDFAPRCSHEMSGRLLLHGITPFPSDRFRSAYPLEATHKWGKGCAIPNLPPSYAKNRRLTLEGGDTRGMES